MRTHSRLPLALAAAGLLLAARAGGQEAIAYPDVSKEIQVARQVLGSPQLTRAMQWVDASDEETVRDWLALCNAYGPQGDEIYRSRLIYKLFRMYGLENVHIDEAKNVVGLRRGTGGGPAVVMNAHHDNVALWPREQPVEAFVADGRVWCPAAGDDLMGVTQILAIAKAMNAGNVQTKGDVWFVTFVGEERGSEGAETFVRANYPHNIDWKKGDIIVQMHGGGGEGVTSGSGPYIHFTELRLFTPVDFDRWRTDAVDALGPIIARVNKELRDPRSTEIAEYETGQGT